MEAAQMEFDSTYTPRSLEGSELQRSSVDDDGYTSLGTILCTYNAPIKEDHAWALCFVSCSYLQHNPTPASSSAGNCNDFGNMTPPETLDEKVMSSVRIHRDGHIFVDGDILGSPRIAMLALVIYKALDYGVAEDEERSLDVKLESLLEKMGSVEEDNLAVLQEVEEKCVNYFQDKIKGKVLPEMYFKQVTQSLVQDFLEFSRLLQIAEDAEKTLNKMDFPTSKNYEVISESDIPEEKDDTVSKNGLSKAWVKVWIQVVRELRRGHVVLKHIPSSVLCNTENYQKTPFELLMDDIRLQNYHLRKVSENPKKSGIGTGASRVMLSDVIMELVQTRPNLRKVPHANLEPEPPTSKKAIEELIKGVRGLKPLRPVHRREQVS